MTWYEAIGKVAVIFAGFALVHSLFVTDRAKAAFGRLVGERTVKAFYRLAFTLWSVALTGLAAYLITRVPDVTLFNVTGAPRVLMRLLQGVGILIGLMSFKVISIGEFTGLSQAIRFLRGHEDHGDVEGISKGRLIRTGAYGMVRNPLYLAGIMLFSFNPDVTRTWLVVCVLADAYFIFGALIEQKRLVKRFGPEYVEYMEEVPLLIPSINRLLRGRRSAGGTSL